MSMRDQIAILCSRGESVRAIARAIGRDPGTVSRELKRNAPLVHRGYYLPHRAHGRATERWQRSHRHPRLRTPRLRAYVRRMLRRGWSPELIAGRWNQLHRSPCISHEAIYW